MAADNQADEDFYFDCTVLKAKLLASTCKQNRKKKQFSEGAWVRHATCKNCTVADELQKQSKMSIEEYHVQVLCSLKPDHVKPVRDFRDYPGNRY